MPDELETLHHLFESVRLFVFQSGGDGGGWIVSDNYISLADAFEKFENDNGKWFIERTNFPEKQTVLFSNSQEYIGFTSQKDFSAEEIVVVLRYV